MIELMLVTTVTVVSAFAAFIIAKRLVLTSTESR